MIGESVSIRTQGTGPPCFPGTITSMVNLNGVLSGAEMGSKVCGFQNLTCAKHCFL